MAYPTRGSPVANFARHGCQAILVANWPRSCSAMWWATPRSWGATSSKPFGHWMRIAKFCVACCRKFNGQMAGEIGDGTLTRFHSAIDAVNCAREVQASLQDQPELKVRIGIHLGDVVFSKNTVLGDGVNVAFAYSRACSSRRNLRLGQHLRRDPQQARNPLQRPRRAETQERVAPDTCVSDRCDRSHCTACRAGRKPTPERANRGRGRRAVLKMRLVPLP